MPAVDPSATFSTDRFLAAQSAGFPGSLGLTTIGRGSVPRGVEMKTSSVARVISVVCTGLYAGIIFGDRMGASFARPALSAADFVVFQQIQHVHFKPLLVPITFAAVLGGLFWVWSLRSSPRGAQFWFAATGTVAMLSAAVVTRVVNFPINDALMTWSATAPPSNIRELWAPWEHVHSVRAALSVCAFVLQVLALNAKQSS
jgi:uncharacterized membrane protein